MINRIYNSIITNPGQEDDKTYGEYINKRFTEEEKYSFEYLINTIPEEMLEDNIYDTSSSEINEWMVKLLIVLAKFVGSSRDLILEMDNIKDIKYLLNKAVEGFSKVNIRESIENASVEEIDNIPAAKLATLTAYELGYMPDLANQEIVDTIKEVLLNRAVIEKLEVIKAHRGSLAAIKELIENMYVIESLPISDSYKITDENLTINIQTTISSLLFRPGTFFYKALRSIKPAGVMLEFPLIGQNIFYDFSGLSNISEEEEGHINKVSITEPYSKIKPTTPRLAPEVELIPTFSGAYIVNITNYNPQAVMAHVIIRNDCIIQNSDTPPVSHNFSRNRILTTTIPAASIYRKIIYNTTNLRTKESIPVKAVIEEAYLTDLNGNYRSPSVSNSIPVDIGAGNITSREVPLLPVKISKCIQNSVGMPYASMFILANPNINNMSARIVIRSKSGQNNIVAASDWYTVTKYSVQDFPTPFYTLEPNPLIKGGEKYYIEVEAKETVSGVVTNAPVERTEFTMHNQVAAYKPTITGIQFDANSRDLTFTITNPNKFPLYGLDVKVRVGAAVFRLSRTIDSQGSENFTVNMQSLVGTAEITADKFTFDSPSNTMPYTKEIQTGLGITYYEITSTQEKTATPTIVSHTCKIITRVEGSLYVQYKRITVGVKNNDNSSVAVYLNDAAKGVLAGRSTNSFSISIDDMYGDDTVNVTVQAPNKTESNIVSIKPTNCTEEPPLVEV